jgi:hypothetical protein
LPDCAAECGDGERIRATARWLRPASTDVHIRSRLAVRRLLPARLLAELARLLAGLALAELALARLLAETA